MKKIIVDKHEGIAEVIDRILATHDAEVVLAIPKGSELAKSASNFRLLKRKADLAYKKIMIDSSDSDVLAFAREYNIEEHRRVPNGVSDIVLRHDHDEEPSRRHKKGASVRLTVHQERESPEIAGEPVETGEGVSEKPGSFLGEDRFFKTRNIPADGDEEKEDDDDQSPRGAPKRALVWALGILLVLGIIGYVVTTVFGRAQVMINFTKTPWNYQANITAGKSVSVADPTANVIPAQVFTTQKNITQLYPATGQSANVGVKAQGMVTIYNHYSSVPQDLVARTRFVTPDGKMFRLTTDVTVPGKPGSITAPIIADQPGPAYNLGPVPKLTIPGFRGGPKYNGFYGAITTRTTGGFVGNRKVPTVADIASAKTKTTAILQADLESGLTASYPNNFKILDGAMSVQMTKLAVATTTDQNGNFSVFGQATLQAIGFDEAAFKSYLLTLAQSAEPSSTFDSLNVSYGNVQANFAKGQVSFALTAEGSLKPAFSPSDFAASIAGKSIGDARATIASLPQLSNGTISVWPIWLSSMPSNPKQISVSAN